MKKFLLLLAGFFAASSFAAPVWPKEFLVGTNAHYYFDELFPADDSMSVMVQAGHNSYRDGNDWGRAENPDGSFRIYEPVDLDLKAKDKFGLSPLFLIGGTHKKIGMRYPLGSDMPAFLKFVENDVKLLKARNVRLLQLWNEWDAGHCMDKSLKQNTSANYVELLKACYPIIRKNAPDALIIGNSFCTGKTKLYEAFQAGMLDYCDAYCIHTYDSQNRMPEFIMPRIEEGSQESAKYNNGVPKPFFVTEFGWLTGKFVISESDQADYIARYYLLIRRNPACKGVYLYNFQDRGHVWTCKTTFWGSMMRDLTPKESYYTMASAVKLVKQAEFVKRIDAGDPDVWILLYKKFDGTYAIAAWTVKKEIRQHLVFDRCGSDTKEVSVERCGNPALKRLWGFYNKSMQKPLPPDGVPVPYPYREVRAKFYPELFSVHVTTRPVILHGVPANVSLKFSEKVFTPQPKAMTAFIPPCIQNVPPKGARIVLDDDADWRYVSTKFTRKGTKDISCTAKITYDDNALHINFLVTDNAHVTVSKDGKFWDGDSIQLSFVPFRRGQAAGSERNDYMIAFADGKPVLVHCNETMDGYAEGGTKAAFTFKKLADNRYSYAFSVPWSEIRADFKMLKSGRTPLGFSFFVNDNDKDARRGYLAWGDAGGGPHRTVSHYGWLIFTRK